MTIKMIARVINDALGHTDKTTRLAILAELIKIVEAWEPGKFLDGRRLIRSEIPPRKPEHEFKALVVQIFVRDIVNQNSPKDAERILFAHQSHGKGSGLLSDYLKILPSVKIID